MYVTVESEWNINESEWRFCEIGRSTINEIERNIPTFQGVSDETECTFHEIDWRFDENI